MVTNNSINQPTAAAGKVLQGAGVGVASTFSTPTYPSTSGTSRNILVSDGTNNVYSTETWAVPGTSGNVLISDGTNWISAGSSTLYEANVTLTSAQIKTMKASPVTLIAAQGAGTVIIIVSYLAKFNYGGTDPFTSGGGSITLGYTAPGIRITSSNWITTAMMYGSATTYSYGNFPNAATYNLTTIANSPVVVSHPTTGEYAGNAAGDNTLSVSAIYKIVTY